MAALSIVVAVGPVLSFAGESSTGNGKRRRSGLRRITPRTPARSARSPDGPRGALEVQLRPGFKTGRRLGLGAIHPKDFLRSIGSAPGRLQRPPLARSAPVVAARGRGSDIPAVGRCRNPSAAKGVLYVDALRIRTHHRPRAAQSAAVHFKRRPRPTRTRCGRAHRADLASDFPTPRSRCSRRDPQGNRVSRAVTASPLRSPPVPGVHRNRHMASAPGSHGQGRCSAVSVHDTNGSIPSGGVPEAERAGPATPNTVAPRRSPAGSLSQLEGKRLGVAAEMGRRQPEDREPGPRGSSGLAARLGQRRRGCSAPGDRETTGGAAVVRIGCWCRGEAPIPSSVACPRLVPLHPDESTAVGGDAVADHRSRRRWVDELASRAWSSRERRRLERTALHRPRWTGSTPPRIAPALP